MAGISLDLARGRFRARLAVTPDDRTPRAGASGARLRAGRPGMPTPTTRCATTFWSRTLRSGEAVCCFRLMPLADGAEIGRSYAAQFYDLSALLAFPGPMVEMGRFCLHPDRHDPDILRVAWGAMTAYVDAQGVAFLFGCASFPGTDVRPYSEAFAALKAHHLAPDRWQPQVKAPHVFRFAENLNGAPDSEGRDAAHAAPCCKTYLTMGGWVSGHAVVDAQMNTLHVFTGVEIAAIPPARKRLLRAVAG